MISAERSRLPSLTRTSSHCSPVCSSAATSRRRSSGRFSCSLKIGTTTEITTEILQDAPPPSLRQRFDVLQHARVDPVDQEVGPPPPVRLRPHAVLVPRRSRQTRTAVGEGRQLELPAVRDEEIVEVRRV